MVHSADDGLPAVAYGHVLNDDTLLASSSVSLQRLDLRREGAGELVERAFRAVLLRNVLDVIETTREGHCGIVNGGQDPLPDAWRRGWKWRAQGRAEWELATRAIHIRDHRRAGGNTGFAPIGS
jgi:hypothetical protein